MENRQIADTVLQLCENNGYTCLNLYRGMIDYARNEGRALDEYFYAGCHPNSGGYLALWRLIADELGLNLPVEDVYARDEVLPQVIDEFGRYVSGCAGFPGGCFPLCRVTAV